MSQLNDAELVQKWESIVRRRAATQQLEAECLEGFHAQLSYGKKPAQAMWAALYDWDCLTPDEMINGYPMLSARDLLQDQPPKEK